MIQRKNIICLKNVTHRNLISVTNVTIAKRGVDSNSTEKTNGLITLFKDLSLNTIHYKIVLHFAQEKDLEILETKSKDKAKRRVIILFT